MGLGPNGGDPAPPLLTLDSVDSLQGWMALKTSRFIGWRESRFREPQNT